MLPSLALSFSNDVLDCVHGTHRKIREPCVGIPSLLIPHGPRGSNSGHRLGDKYLYPLGLLVSPSLGSFCLRQGLMGPRLASSTLCRWPSAPAFMSQVHGFQACAITLAQLVLEVKSRLLVYEESTLPTELHMEIPGVISI